MRDEMDNLGRNLVQGPACERARAAALAMTAKNDYLRCAYQSAWTFVVEKQLFFG